MKALSPDYRFIACVVGLLLAQTTKGQISNGLNPLPFSQVQLTDDFWQPRLQTQMETLVPFAFEKTYAAQEALKLAGDYLAGLDSPLPSPHRYRSSDLFKVMEGAAYLLHNQPDPALERQMDSLIQIIGRAQQKDGYLYVAHTTGVSKDHDHWEGGGMGDRPYSFVLHSHELYNMGHMYEAAIAYYQATGKDQWLKIAEKNAQHINRVFFEGDPNYNNGKPVNQAPGHEELELALTKLYRLTQNPRYLEMAQKFLAIRGKTYQPQGEGVMSAEYSQQHLPVAEQRQAAGHAVRAAYLYSSMAEVAALSASSEYQAALNSIWQDIVNTKMSITGGLGAVRGIEGFGPAYVLPNKDAYNETCAAVGNVFFNFRMFLQTRDATFMDVAEVALLNNALAGVNLAGNRFFYVNPLEADGTTPFNQGQAGRAPWFNTACCPSNIARLIPQVAGMLYAYEADTIYTNFYASSTTKIPLPTATVALQQQTSYPFDGQVLIQVNPSTATVFEIRLRIPNWCRSTQFVPGDLYQYLNSSNATWSVSINGSPYDATLENGFAVIRRKWQPGDEIQLYLPMPVRFSRSNEAVAANRRRVAITRGPLVFAAEGVDNVGAVQAYYLDQITENTSSSVQNIEQGILQGLPQISLPAQRQTDNQIQPETLKLIPYYAWNNRGNSTMLVWLPTTDKDKQ